VVATFALGALCLALLVINALQFHRGRRAAYETPMAAL